MIFKLLKIYRFILIYGLGRTIYKVLGRMRNTPKILTNSNRHRKHSLNVGFIGCGQFSFATISYFVNNSHQYHIRAAYDIDKDALKSFCHFNNVPIMANSIEDFFKEKLDFVYIASNHFSHTGYAVKAVELEIPVHIEKPICVNWEQYDQLRKVISQTKTDVFTGYNRPFSPAIIELKQRISNIKGPFTLNCYVSGHLIESGHWYREPEEGTRVCGNLGHWIDLAVHILNGETLPEYINIKLVSSSNDTRDDNFCVVMTTSNGDLITLILTSRDEPFEGINETINFAKGDVLAKIDDFRVASYWVGKKVFKRKYFPKDVGHKNAILQHLNKNKYKRDLNEVRLSTALMLEIKDMVISNKDEFRFYPNNKCYKW